MPSYEDFGFNNFLTRRRRVFEPTEDITSIKIPQIAGENIETTISALRYQSTIPDVVRRTAITGATSSSIGDNGGVTLHSTLKPPSLPNKTIFGIPEISCYMDSISDDNLVPYGANTYQDHVATVWHDWDAGQESPSPTKFLRAEFSVRNNSGAPHIYLFRIQWRYLGASSLIGTSGQG